MWFREDLRVSDNTALYHACQTASEGVIALFLLTPNDWRKHHVAACKIDFMRRGLIELHQALAKLNIPLLIEKVDSYQAIPALLAELMYAYQTHALFFNKQYEINELRRDQAVRIKLTEQGLRHYSYDDQVVAAPGKVLTQKGEYFKVFTPFKKAWAQIVCDQGYSVYPIPQPQRQVDIAQATIPQTISGFTSTVDSSLWPAGEQYAQQRLTGFISERLNHYNIARDYPAKTGTSQLSPYLTTGMLSIRQCLKLAQDANNGLLISEQSGASTWISELIWREFYRHILVAFPRVSMDRPFNLATERITWDNNVDYFQAWQQGQTGYPLVDAAMRQLKATGWMHNRLRMVTAMFLCKSLFIDWRWGERFFMQQLIDGDFASNNGGWQWSASTGTDSSPYFRIFNPTLQSERFDPAGDFIRHYCPELAALDNQLIHAPYAKNKQEKLDYPKPVIDHTANKHRVIVAFKRLKE